MITSAKLEKFDLDSLIKIRYFHDSLGKLQFSNFNLDNGGRLRGHIQLNMMCHEINFSNEFYGVTTNRMIKFKNEDTHGLLGYEVEFLGYNDVDEKKSIHNVCLRYLELVLDDDRYFGATCRIDDILREGHFFMILCIPKMNFFHRF